MKSNKSNTDFHYKKVTKKIKNKIINNTFEVNQKIPSERELCDIYSVSRTTVRKAIDELVAKGLLVKKPGKGTYVSSDINKKDYVRTRTKNILFVRCTHVDFDKSNTSIDNDIFYPKVQTGVELKAATREYHCIVKTINENNFSNKELEQSIEKVDGIICGELHNVNFLDGILKTNLPIVLINPSVYTHDVDVVSIDNITGAYHAVNFLINSGHKKIGFIGGNSTSFPSKRRKQGYTDALLESGIPVDNSLMFSKGWCFEDGYYGMKKLLKNNNELTAVFTASDLLGLGAINAIKDIGLKIPDDISIVGFDDIEMCNQITPSLSTMKVRKITLGKVATSLIFEQFIEKRDYSINVSIPTILKKRESVRKL